MVNDHQRQSWSDGAAGWVENEGLFDAVFAPITAAILDAAAIQGGQRLLDIGCGSGTLLVAGVAAGADVVGIDISPGMAAAAQRRVPDGTVVVGDAQTIDLLSQAPGAPFDRVVSRFGVMFFADPVAAFANVRHSAAAGARLAFACWRSEAENLTFTLGTSVLERRLDPPPEAQEPGGPGPMAFADRDHVLAVLGRAGWTEAHADALDVTLDYGIDGSDGVAERFTMILGTATGRLARAQLEPKLGPRGWGALLDEVRAEIGRHRVDGVVRFPGAIWLVTAANPSL